MSRRPTTGLAAARLSPILLAAALVPAHAQDLPEPVEGDFTIENFEFGSGETLEELTIHYRTLGDPEDPAVLVLHGTTGSGGGMLGEGFADALFESGQPLAADEHYLILPDAIGHGDSSKPSDGMRASFPRYDLEDMVHAHHRLLTEGLGVEHLRLVIGNSMGGMLAWIWGIEYPDYMDALVPMASLPAPMSGRNWMMRRMVIDSVRNDPAWNGGDYEEQPPNLATATAWFATATSGGNLWLQEQGATREAADAFIDERLATVKVGDANDTMYQWDSSRNFDPSEELDKIQAHVLVINSADDERNPPELMILEERLPTMANAEAFVIPASEETRGHGTTGSRASLYADELGQWLDSVPTRAD